MTGELYQGQRRVLTVRHVIDNFHNFILRFEFLLTNGGTFVRQTSK